MSEYLYNAGLGYRDVAAKSGDAQALRFAGNESISHVDLNALANRIAHILLAEEFAAATSLRLRTQRARAITRPCSRVSKSARHTSTSTTKIRFRGSSTFLGRVNR